MSLVYKNLTSVVPIGGVSTLTGNTGGAVSPSSGNINVVGSGNITVTGNNGTHTLTASLTGNIGVSNGGTGAGSFTAYSVICAGTTSTGAFQNVSGVGTAGQVLTSNGAGALPSWQAGGASITLTGDSGGGLTGSSFTITGGTSGGLFAGSGSTLTLSFSSLKFAGTTILAAPGTQNTFVGYGSGNVAGGAYNTASGYQALNTEASGSSNTAYGTYALFNQNGASYNTAFGYSAGSGITTGQYNIYMGYQAGANAAKTNNENIAMGYQSGYNLTSGQRNLAMGSNTLQISSGSYNIHLGWSAGQSNTTSDSSNIYFNNLGAGGESNVLRIGGGAGSGAQQLAKAFIHGIRGITTGNNDAIAVLVDSAGQLGTVSSSIRYKENVSDMGDVSSPVLDLRPVTFDFIGKPSHKKQVGLIAEEVEQVMPSLVAYNSDGQVESVKYHELPVLLLNELQKALKRIEELESKIK